MALTASARQVSGVVSLHTPWSASADSGSVAIRVPRGTRYRVGGTTGWGTRRIDATTSAGEVTVRYAAP